MRDVLIWILAFLVTWIVLLVVVATLLRWRLHRRNRVSPAVRSPAPLTWLWSPRPPARLHRRLQGAVADIHLAPSRRSPHRSDASVDDLRRELEYQAVELDHHLVIATRHPRRERRSILRSLDQQVADVEELSARLSRLRSRPEGTPASGWDAVRQPPEVLSDIAHQLDLLDAAQEELTAIERAAGLVDGADGLALAEHDEDPSPPSGGDLSPPPSATR
jgi:uncharacterized membrane protein